MTSRFYPKCKSREKPWRLLGKWGGSPKEPTMEKTGQDQASLPSSALKEPHLTNKFQSLRGLGRKTAFQGQK